MIIMLTIRKENYKNQDELIILESLVPKNHLVRKVENSINFSSIYAEVIDLYSPVVKSTIDSVVIIKIVLIQCVFGILCMRQKIREIKVNIAYLLLLGYSLQEKIHYLKRY